MCYTQSGLYLITILRSKKITMKKILVLAVAAFLVSGVSFAQDGNGKKCSKGGKQCSKECKDGKKKTEAKKA